MRDDRKLTLSAQRVTVGELADFSSGMPILAPNLPPRLEMRGIEHYRTKDFLDWICHWNAPDNLPAPYNYSNFSIGLVGYLVSDATGQSWEELLRRWITGPLGMKDTMLRLGADQRHRLATGHTSYGTDAPEWPVYAWYAAGGLRSTVDDMLRFGDANLGHAATGGVTVPPELIAALKLAHEQRYMLPNEKAAQALAWEVINPAGENGLAPLIVKSGGTAGFGCDFLLDPTDDAAAYIVMNQSNSNPQKLGIEIIRGLFAVSALADSQFSGKRDDKFAVTVGQEKKVVTTKEAPQAFGPFSQAIKAGGFIFTAGQIAIDPATGKLVEGDVKAQTERVLKNLSAVLAAAGSSMDRIVKTTVFLKNISDFPAMNEVYGQFFKNEPPSRSTVQVVALAKDALIEIEAVALQ